MLAFLEKLNLTPEKISPKDIEPLKAAGLSATAIVDGLNVCFLFNTVNRLANTLGYDWGGEANARRGAVFLNRAEISRPGVLAQLAARIGHRQNPDDGRAPFDFAARRRPPLTCFRTSAAAWR